MIGCCVIIIHMEKEITKPMLERLVHIHNKIVNKTYPNTKELSKFLEVSIPTVSRDIEFLRDRFNAPIAYDRAINGYYYTEKFTLPLNSLSSADMEVLVSAKVLLAHFSDTPLHKKLCDIIDFLMPDQKDSSMMNRIAIKPARQAFYDKEIWNTIYKAMKTNSVLYITYKGLWQEETKRRVRPYQLLMDDGAVYLLGFCELRGEERIFSLCRMKEVIITDDTFTLPSDYDYSTRCDGGKFGFYFTNNKKHFKIRFFGVGKQAVKEQLWADDQKFTDGKNYVDLIFTSNQEKKILHWVLSQGYNVLPLEPESLVKEWKTSIKKMSDMAGLN